MTLDKKSIYMMTKAKNEICIAYVSLHLSVVKRFCYMSKPRLHLDTQTEKLVFGNSKHWYLLQHQNWMSHRLKCSWCRSLDWTPTGMIKKTTIWKVQWMMYTNRGSCHTSKNSLFPLARGAQLPCMSPYLGYTLGGPITWLADQLCKKLWSLTWQIL